MWGVKVQTPLARLRHGCATAEPFQGQLGHRWQQQDGQTIRVKDEREEEE